MSEVSFPRRDVPSYSGTIQSSSLWAEPSDIEGCRRTIENAVAKGLKICPRGAGNSYGDQNLFQDQIVLSLAKMDKVLSWDKERGLLTVEPGATYTKMLGVVLPDLWAVDIVVGTPDVTAAGALSNNVHGKTTFKSGNFGETVVRFKLLQADGTIIDVSRETQPELFSAVIGGMGLLGIVVEIEIQCRRIPSPYVECKTESCANLSELIDMIEAGQKDSDFLIAWVDAFARGKGLGRGFVHCGKWAEKDAVSAETIKRSLLPATRVFGLFPKTLTWGILRWFFGSTFVHIANIVRYHLTRWRGVTVTNQLFPDFNFLHNKIPGLNDVYYPYGFMEFEPIIPKSAGIEGIKKVLELCQKRGFESILCGLKIHRPDQFMISFEGSGYSFGVDFSMRGRRREEVAAFAQEFFSLIADLGGKTYLAKDEILPRKIFQRMYPRYREFLNVKKRVDPKGIFASDMYRRLFEDAHV